MAHSICKLTLITQNRLTPSPSTIEGWLEENAMRGRLVSTDSPPVTGNTRLDSPEARGAAWRGAWRRAGGERATELPGLRATDCPSLPPDRRRGGVDSRRGGSERSHPPLPRPARDRLLTARRPLMQITAALPRSRLNVALQTIERQMEWPNTGDAA